VVQKLEFLRLVRCCNNKEAPLHSNATAGKIKSDAHQLTRAKRKIQDAKLIGDLKMGNKSRKDEHVRRRRGLLPFRSACSTSGRRVGLQVAGCRHRSRRRSGGRRRRGGRRRQLAAASQREAVVAGGGSSRPVAPMAGGGAAASRRWWMHAAATRLGDDRSWRRGVWMDRVQTFFFRLEWG